MMSKVQKFETSSKTVIECIKDLYVTPRELMMKWSKLTNQTFNTRMAYPSQHLASVITGIRGKGTAARGDDLSDGTEVKSCSRADQLSECNNCGIKLLLLGKRCPNCDSEDINVKTDSHWIFPIKNEYELNLLLNKVPRILLILFDKDEKNQNIIRLRVWHVDPSQKHVQEFFTNYYTENYLKKDEPAPCNLHPLMFDFYMMDPCLIFHADINFENGNIQIQFWDPDSKKKEEMPTILLKNEELAKIFTKEEIKKKILSLPEKYKTSYLKQFDKNPTEKNMLCELYPNVPFDNKQKLTIRKKTTSLYKEKYARR